MQHSELSKQLMSLHSFGVLNPMYGKHHSKETKNKIKKSLQNHKNTSKMVRCIETLIVYPSIREASR